MEEDQKKDSNDCNNKIFHFINFVGLIVYFGIMLFAGIILFSIVFGIISGVVTFFIIILLHLSLLIASVVFFGVWIAVIYYVYHWINKVSDKTKNLILNYSEKGSDKPHHAIIMAKPGPKIHKIWKWTFKREREESYLSGEDLIIEKFQHSAKEINYKVYEVSSKEQVIPLILDKNITHLWIFGHGSRNRVSLEKGNLCYFEIRNEVRKAFPKVFIGQYHCNSLIGKSLGDYNNPQIQDITRGPRMDILLRLSVKIKLKELESKDLL
jgi:hypothetical protein